MARRVRIHRAALAAALVLAGCSGGDEEPAARPSSEEQPSSTVTSAVDDASTTSVSATTTAAAAIVLRGDGLGVIALGAVPADAITAVTDALGDPTRDSGWQSSFSEYGTCPGTNIRGVEWDHLVLLFTDGDTAWGSGEHLFAWRITGAPPALGTASGLGYLATVTDAEELYPGGVDRTDAEDPFPGFLTIAAEGGPITAYLDGDTITNLEAGVACGE